MKSEKKRRAQIRAIYSRMPKLDCKGLCHNSCGPIMASPLEARVLEEKGVQLPVVNSALSFVKEVFLQRTCPALTKDHRCRVYNDRPIICRLYGMVLDPRMICEHGCEPDRWLSSAEGHALIDAVQKLGE